MAPDLPTVVGELLANQRAQTVRTAGDQNTFNHVQLRARQSAPYPNGSA
jgi:pectin methylesterase-like acyl-CoA thioesterase